MNDTLKKRLAVALLLFACLWYAGAAMANATLERSGSWYDPARDGEAAIPDHEAGRQLNWLQDQLVPGA